MISVLLISVGLAMDAFVVAISSGCNLKKNKGLIKLSLLCGIMFGLFQFIMPIIGFYTAKIFSSYFNKYDNYFSFILLLIIGIKMIFETISEKEEIEPTLKFFNIFILAIATSIDALAVGVAFKFETFPIFTSSIVIGIVALIFSFFGVIIGKKLGNIIGNKGGIFGGIVLIIIGFKFLLT